MADAHERRNEARRAHLREVVLDFLAAADAYFKQEGVQRDTVDRFRRKLAEKVGGTNVLAVEIYKERQTLREVASEVSALSSRMRLYSNTLATPALALLVDREPTVGRDDPALSDAEYNRAHDNAIDTEVDKYHEALEAFIAKARAELGIEGL